MSSNLLQPVSKVASSKLTSGIELSRLTSFGLNQIVMLQLRQVFLTQTPQRHWVIMVLNVCSPDLKLSARPRRTRGSWRTTVRGDRIRLVGMASTLGRSEPFELRRDLGTAVFVTVLLTVGLVAGTARSTGLTPELAWTISFQRPTGGEGHADTPPATSGRVRRAPALVTQLGSRKTGGSAKSRNAGN